MNSIQAALVWIVRSLWNYMALQVRICQDYVWLPTMALTPNQTSQVDLSWAGPLGADGLFLIGGAGITNADIYVESTNWLQVGQEGIALYAANAADFSQWHSRNRCRAPRCGSLWE